jgi:hypothetical protein
MQADQSSLSAIAAMECAKKLADVLIQIAEIISALADKGVTLEEKMMRADLHELAAVAAQCSASLHRCTEYGDTLNEQLLNSLQEICQEAAGSLQELEKAIKHNLNYLEQYFEYDFNVRMRSQYRYRERLGEIAAQLAVRCDERSKRSL